MSLYRANNHDQNIVLHIGPQFVFEEVKQMKNIINLNITCCKSSPGKVYVSMEIEKNIKNLSFNNNSDVAEHV